MSHIYLKISTSVETAALRFHLELVQAKQIFTTEVLYDSRGKSKH